MIQITPRLAINLDKLIIAEIIPAHPYNDFIVPEKIRLTIDGKNSSFIREIETTEINKQVEKTYILRTLGLL